MKLDARRIPAFLRDPGPTRIVLLHGEDEGMVRHRADTLTLSVVGQKDDPFRVAWLGRDEHERLEEEASAIAMLGGRRVIRVREAADALAAVVEQVAAAPGDSLVLLEAGALAARSKLRSLVEGLASGAAIACYPEEGAALQGAIQSGLAAAGIALDPDAMAWLMDRVGSDRASTRGEIEKLILYAGTDRRLDLDAVRACVGDQGSVAFDDAVAAAMQGDVVQADRATERALAEGLAAVGFVRGVMGYLARMHQARAHMAQGASAEQAVGALRPPVFFKKAAPLARAVQAWSIGRLASAMQEARRVELACKQTGAADALLVRRLVLTLARQAAQRR